MTNPTDTKSAPAAIAPEVPFLGARVTIELAIDSDTILREFFHPLGATSDRDADNAEMVTSMILAELQKDDGQFFAEKIKSYLERTDDGAVLGHLAFTESTKPKALTVEVVATDDRAEFQRLTDSDALEAFAAFREGITLITGGDLEGAADVFAHVAA